MRFRPVFLRACLVLIGLLLMNDPAGAAPAPGPEGRLNVVLIVADDLGAHDLGCTGSKFFETPHIDSLAAQGMRFNQAYAACTVCSPSRAALLTGRSPARLHLTDWIPGHAAPKAKLRPPDWTRELALTETTIAGVLKSQGWTTAHIGKWHLGDASHSPETQGFDINLGGDHRGQPPSYFAPYQLPRLPDGPAGEYLTDREGEEAARFIATHAREPFLLQYWPYAVHTPLQAPPTVTAHFQDRAKQIQGSQTNATYAAMIQRLDAAVGRILAALDEHDLTERTLVIFTSDNGGLVLGSNPPTSNAPLRGGKGSPYEGGHRVPLLVRWPGVTPPGSTCDVPVIGTDLFSTIAEATGAPAVPGPRDGRSLVGLLRESHAATGGEDLCWHYPHYHPGGATPYAAIRSGDWKLIQYYENGRHELFNLREDPGEAHNLGEEQPERVVQLSRRLFAWQGKVGAQWPMPNPAWTPNVVAAGPDGTLHLHSRDALVHGEVLRYEPQPFKNTLGWWTRADDWVSWSFEIPSAGAYRVSFLHGCGNGSGGSEVRFTLGDSTLSTVIVQTGGFQSFTNRVLGEVNLPAGRHTLEVRPLKKPALAVMDLREVVLQPLRNGE